jgi:hypothetical protein
MNFWVHKGGRDWGPYTLVDLKKYVKSGQLNKADEACLVGENKWTTVNKILEKYSPPVKDNRQPVFLEPNILHDEVRSSTPQAPPPIREKTHTPTEKATPDNKEKHWYNNRWLIFIILANVFWLPRNRSLSQVNTSG